jgi:hypothetical protein
MNDRTTEWKDNILVLHFHIHLIDYQYRKNLVTVSGNWPFPGNPIRRWQGRASRYPPLCHQGLVGVDHKHRFRRIVHSLHPSHSRAALRRADSGNRCNLGMFETREVDIGFIGVNVFNQVAASNWRQIIRSLAHIKIQRLMTLFPYLVKGSQHQKQNMNHVLQNKGGSRACKHF